MAERRPNRELPTGGFLDAKDREIAELRAQIPRDECTGCVHYEKIAAERDAALALLEDIKSKCIGCVTPDEHLEGMAEMEAERDAALAQVAALGQPHMIALMVERYLRWEKHPLFDLPARAQALLDVVTGGRLLIQRMGRRAAWAELSDALAALDGPMTQEKAGG